ncbi:MAG: glutamyl-tRNA reductase [Planctomycetaceae bacterium]|jgi:glutamyl-tRNA reductase|nr:glutamyl-tRNA reductase [Planctomycetaceae bacterium]
MGICVIGLNYKSASIEIRERFAFSCDEIKSVLCSWSDYFVGCEAVLLSTCNRTEIYISDDGVGLPDSGQVVEYLLKQKFISQSVYQDVSILQEVSKILPHIFFSEGLSAVEHLFSVASGLESMLLGEVQISSQVKSAYQAASDSGTVGAVLNRLFQVAFKTAKQVANETDLHKHRVSLPSIAVVDFALQIFERLDDKRILVFGAGEMGRETLQYLCAYGAKNITIANRSIDKAESLAVEFGGCVADWGCRFDLIVDADLVVSATGSSECVVSFSDFKRVELRRGNRVLFVLDLAVPRDFDPLIGGLSNIYLYSIDDLREACERNRAGRDREVPKALQIIQRNVNDFMSWLSCRPSGVVIQKLREQLEGLKDVEVERLFNKLSDLDEREKSEIIYSFDRFIGKVLHLPLSSLRDESQHGEPHKLLTALARLFRINNE